MFAEQHPSAYFQLYQIAGSTMKKHAIYLRNYSLLDYVLKQNRNKNPRSFSHLQLAVLGTLTAMKLKMHS